MPPPPKPPVAQESRLPGGDGAVLLAADLDLAEGRRAVARRSVSSVARSRKSLTGLPPALLRKTRADFAPQASGANLLPKPPPM